MPPRGGICSTIESRASFDKPVVTLFGNKDPISRGFEKDLQARIPVCEGQDHRILKDVGHFSPEEAPEELANFLLTFISSP